jgi:hypothetical protein
MRNLFAILICLFVSHDEIKRKLNFESICSYYVRWEDNIRGMVCEDETRIELVQDGIQWSPILTELKLHDLLL